MNIAKFADKRTSKDPFQVYAQNLKIIILDKCLLIQCHHDDLVSVDGTRRESKHSVLNKSSYAFPGANTLIHNDKNVHINLASCDALGEKQTVTATNKTQLARLNISSDWGKPYIKQKFDRNFQSRNLRGLSV